MELDVTVGCFRLPNYSHPIDEKESNKLLLYHDVMNHNNRNES